MSRHPVSIRDVANMARVSVGTVSNVLNRPDVVAESTRRRVLDAIRDLGFVRNESARHLRAGHSRTVGLVVLDVANPFFTDVARGVEDAANDAGLVVILCNSDDNPAKESRYLDLLEEQRVQGILVTPVTATNNRLERLRRRGTPIVLLDRRATEDAQCSVAVDDVLGGELAVAHLLAQGHEHLAFVGALTIRQVQDRYQGAVQAMRAAGRDAAELHVVESTALNVAAGRDATARLAGATPRPTAVFCANDLLALGVLQEMTRRRVRIPQDVAIVGYDDIDFAAAAAVPLTSVRQPRQLLGRTAAELLIEETTEDSGHQHRQVVFDPELVVRDSSDRTIGRPPRRRHQPRWP
ncbi:LacI family transcriptional regulator [Streptosporangium album]|uniref:LacI family transcriptional regulator n=1 Tax=Streptosporangium album TaxID=47479 RepID=A0A7W7S3S1_9ACTN|nr:LacI family DNA-binding transcriptional regulator [Streptosporangium album]MBB4943341.1 LacI family transcriptional regulator [Streptosporangium album]